MAQPSVFLITGAPCTGKSTLAEWLCRRLPQPVTGVCTLCTGRCGAGPLFSLRDLATGAVIPCTRAADGEVSTLYNIWDGSGAGSLQKALQGEGGTLRVDEALPPHPDCPVWNEALAAVLQSGRPVVVTVAADRLAAIRPLLPGAGVQLLDLDTASPESLRAALAETLPAPLHPGVTVRLFREEKCFGPGPMQLLELVGRTGSLHRAAAVMGMAYSKAWKILRELEGQWGFAMLERRPGGTGGGGSSLTPEGWALLARYRALRWETEAAARQAFARYFGNFPDGGEIRPNEKI